MNKLLIVCGPTATGKTNLAVALAQKIDGEVVSADSRQVYKGMDIATGKDIPKGSQFQQKFIKQINGDSFSVGTYEIEGTPVWMYDVALPSQLFSVSHYVQLAHPIIEDIHRRGKIPIIAGGTGFYIKGLLGDIATIDTPPDTSLRSVLQKLPLSSLQEILAKEAPFAWPGLNQSDRQNPRRLIRKIEIGRQGENPKQKKTPVYQALKIGLRTDMKTLYENIDARVDKRLKQGSMDEIVSLLSSGVTWDMHSMNTLGYKEWRHYFEAPPENEKTLTEEKVAVIARWKFDEHGLARRQLTWLSRDASIMWFDITKTSWKSEVEANVLKWYT